MCDQKKVTVDGATPRYRALMNERYEDLYLNCRCGNRIGGTTLRAAPVVEFTCLTCHTKWRVVRHETEGVVFAEEHRG